MDCVVLKHVSKTIKGHQILTDISLQLEAGESYGFTGINGSGKSMLFRIIAGLVIPSSGEVIVEGQNLYSPKRTFPRSLGLMVDAVGLFPHFTGRENLAYLAAIRDQIHEAEIDQAIRRVGLDPENPDPYSKYSLGMKQRLIIAQAIMEEPELLIFDEPTNALDTEGRRLFQQIVEEEHQRGATILISSHHEEDLIASCKVIFPMEQGTIQLAGEATQEATDEDER